MKSFKPESSGKLRQVFLLSLALNLAAILFVIYLFRFPDTIKNWLHPVVPSTNLKVIDPYAQERKTLFTMMPKDTHEIIFVGNSLTDRFPLQEMFQNLKIKNRGISGNRSHDLLERIEEIADRHPYKIFIEIGINDILNGVNPDTLFQNSIKIVETIQQKSPNSMIIVQSLLPTSMDMKKFIPKIIKHNEVLQAWCLLHKIRYIDLYPHFVQSGELNAAYTFDGLHINGAGYMLWKQLIDQEVRE